MLCRSVAEVQKEEYKQYFISLGKGSVTSRKDSVSVIHMPHKLAGGTHAKITESKQPVKAEAPTAYLADSWAAA